MIFSAEKWNDADEIKKFVKVSKALSFANMEAPLNNAFNLFIATLLGESMTAELISIYKYGPDPNEVAEGEVVTDQEKADWKLLQLCQRANANLALWYDFDEINTRITDSGFQRQESENGTLKQAYKYQENNLRQNFKNKGFNALDQVLAFIEDNISFYDEFKESDLYKFRKEAIVKSTKEIDDVYFINGSRIIFLRLQPHIKAVSEYKLRTSLGDALYDQLLIWIKTDNLAAEIAAKAEQLRLKAGVVVILEAIKRLMLETGSLTDRGLYFASIQANKDSDENYDPVDAERVAMQVQQISVNEEASLTQLMKYVRHTFPDLYLGNPQRVFDRDNDKKTTFWA